MPNYNLSVTSQYNPFTFDELLKPAILATQYHDLLMDLYNQLEILANTLEKLANNAKDAELYNLYKLYANDVKAAQDALYNQGLNAQSRRKALQLKARYASDITPIEEAIKRRNELSDLYMKASINNPYFRSDYDPSQVGLNEYMNNLNYNALSKTADLSQIEKQMSIAASNLLRELRGFKVTDIKDRPGLLEVIESSGLSATDTLAIMSALNDPNSALNKTILGLAAQQVLNASGVNKWDRWETDPNLLNEVYGALQLGAMSAIGKTDINLHNDPSYDKNADKAYYSPVSLLGNPYPLASRLDVNKSQIKHNEFAEYFDQKTGELTDKGWEEYLRQGNKVVGSSITGYTQTADDTSDFKKFIDSLNNGKSVTNRSQIKTLYELNAARLVEEGNLNADILINTAFDVQFADSKKAKQVLTSGKNTGRVPTEEYTKDGYKATGKTINLNDDEFKDATYAGEYGLLGNYVVITTTNNKLYRVPLSVVHPSLDRSIKARMREVLNTYLKYGNLEGFNAPRLVGNNIMSPLDYAYGHLNSSRGEFLAAFEQGKVEDFKVKGGQLNVW